MVSVNNFGNRNQPSVNYGRTNIWNRYAQHAQMKRDASLFSCHCHSHQAPPPPPMAYHGFGGFDFGGFGGGFGGFGFGPRNNTEAAGFVIGSGISLIAQFKQPIGNFFKNLFS